MSGGYGNTVGTRVQQQAGVEDLQPKQARGVATGRCGAFGRMWEGGVRRDTHAGDGVVGGVPRRVVTGRAGEPRVGEDVMHSQATGRVTAQQGSDEVTGARADPLWHLELPTPDLGEER